MTIEAAAVTCFKNEKRSSHQIKRSMFASASARVAPDERIRLPLYTLLIVTIGFFLSFVPCKKVTIGHDRYMGLLGWTTWGS